MKITQTEGVTALWRGLPPTLLMAVPATVIYFVGYETIRTSLENNQLNPYAPLIAGGLARCKPVLCIFYYFAMLIIVIAISASIISPVELIRTRLQSGQFGESKRYQTVLGSLSQMYSEQIVFSKGVSESMR